MLLYGISELLSAVKFELFYFSPNIYISLSFLVLLYAELVLLFLSLIN